jgi:sulfur carrier protein
MPTEGMGRRPYPFRHCGSAGAERDTVFCFMRLTINGEIFDTAHTETVLELLREIDVNPGLVAVEVNLSIIKKTAYSTYRLNEGDKVEIVNFVGGG